MKLNAIAKKNHDWVVRMGWHKSTVLECLGLIASEVGEVAECLIEAQKRRNLGEELADVVLRVLYVGHAQGIDLEQALVGAKAKECQTVWDGYAEIMIAYGKWANTARQEELRADFAEGLGVFLLRVIHFADFVAVDLENQVLRKMAINETRGTRGRTI